MRDDQSSGSARKRLVSAVYIYNGVREKCVKNSILSTAIPASYINNHSQHADCYVPVYKLGILRSEIEIFLFN